MSAALVIGAFECPICKGTGRFRVGARQPSRKQGAAATPTPPRAVVDPVLNPSCCAHVFCAEHVEQFFDGGGVRDCPTCFKSLGGRRNLVRDAQLEAFLRVAAPDRAIDDDVDLSIFACAPPLPRSVAAPAPVAPVRQSKAARVAPLRASAKTAQSLPGSSEAQTTSSGRRSSRQGGAPPALDGRGARSPSAVGSKRRRPEPGEVGSGVPSSSSASYAPTQGDGSMAVSATVQRATRRTGMLRGGKGSDSVQSAVPALRSASASALAPPREAPSSRRRFRASGSQSSVTLEPAVPAMPVARAIPPKSVVVAAALPVLLSQAGVGGGQPQFRLELGARPAVTVLPGFMQAAIDFIRGWTAGAPPARVRQ